MVSTVASFVVVLGVLIFIHELGHFVVAKWSGVGVDRFSLGFGPVLFSIRRGETEYCISAVPLGGYVKMMGEESPMEGGGSAVVDSAKAFAGKPVWQRFLIVFAGPGMNFVLAALLVMGLFMVLGRPGVPSVVGRVEQGSPAAQAGLQSGDRIIAVDGQPIVQWEELVERLQEEGGGGTIQVTVRRQDAERKVALTPVKLKVRDLFGDEKSIWEIGARPYAPARVGEVVPGRPAARAGLKAGDIVVALDGRPILDFEELADIIYKRPGQTTLLTVERNGERLDIMVVPELGKLPYPGGEDREVGQIGIGRAAPSAVYVRSNPVTAIGQAVIWTSQITSFVLWSLWKLVTRQIAASNIGGPIQIAVAAGQQARLGLEHLILFTAGISVNLAVLNLLPIPMLDGGHLLFFIIEAIIGRPLSVRKREIAQQVGFFFLMLLMVFAVYNDLSRIDLFRFLK